MVSLLVCERLQIALHTHTNTLTSTLTRNGLTLLLADYLKTIRALDSMVSCVPFLGIVRTHLIHAEENGDTTGDGLVNFEKVKNIADIIRNALRWQRVPYDLFEVGSSSDIIFCF